VVFVRFRAFREAIVQQFVQQFWKLRSRFPGSKSATHRFDALRCTNNVQQRMRCRSSEFQRIPGDFICRGKFRTAFSISRTQFTAAPPQHFLYFLPEPHGHWSFRPTLGALRRGSLRCALALTCRCARK
jgi:hypothetical protein